MKLRSASGSHVMLPISLIRAGVNLLESLHPLETSLKNFPEVSVSCDFLPRAISSRNISIRGDGNYENGARGSGIAAFQALKEVSYDISRERVDAELDSIKSRILEQSPAIERYGRLETKSLMTPHPQARLQSLFSRLQLKDLEWWSLETRYLLMFSNGRRKDAVQRAVNISSSAAVHFDFAVGVGGGPRFLDPQLQDCLISVADLGRSAD